MPTSSLRGPVKPGELQELPTLSQPQRLGILPTMAFWRRPDVRPFYKRTFTGVTFILGLGAAAVEGYYPAGLGGSALLGLSVAGALYLSVGVFERWVRRQMYRRRLPELR